VFLTICMPFTTDRDILIPEKLPGPEFIKIEKLSSSLILYLLTKLRISKANISFLIRLVCNFFIKNLLFTFNAIESFLPVQSIIKKSLIIFLFFISSPEESLSMSDNIEDKGIIVLMYHRFEENKYPSTNTKIVNFIKQINLIKKNGFSFVNANNFEKSLLNTKNNKKILLTIDDAFKSFYDQAWPVLKKDKIPFLLFVSTREVGSNGYMTWNQIREISKEKFVHIGNHSHSHEYLVDKTDNEIRNDINLAISDFEKNLKYNSPFFSYPFGEYSNSYKNIIKNFGFKYAFGQHSGVVDETKDFYELPRFSINEKYGELKRFKLILKTIPLKFKSITPSEKYINNSTNPPTVIIEFFEDIQNIKLLNCYSNELNSWRKSEIEYLNNFKIKIKLIGKFTSERGRVNCSLREPDGSWRWLGMQFVVAEL
jgi:peptidoglycan/xylan/chitin deacetylase (PgdA/CDA1 family)